MQTSDAPVDLASAPPPAIDVAPAEAGAAARALAELADVPAAAELASLLADVARAAVAEGDAIVGALAAAQGFDLAAPAAGEAWIDGPRAIALAARLGAQALSDVARGRAPRPPHGSIGERDRRAVVRLAPPAGAGRALHGGLAAEVRFAEGVRARDVRGRSLARWAGPADPGVALVVASAAAPLRAAVDAVRAVQQRRAALVALPPALAPLAPALDRALAPLVARGLARVVVAPDPLAIAADPRVASAVAPRAPGPTPLLVVPTLYASDELAVQAATLAADLAWGGGLGPFAPRLLVVARGWPQRERFVDLVRAALAAWPAPPSRDPARAERFEAALAARSDVARPAPAAPFAIALAVDAAAPGPLFAPEPMGPVLGVVEVGDDDPAAFLDAAARFVGERLEGVVAASIVAPPHHEEDPALEALLEAAVARLPARVVGLSAPPRLAAALGSVPWAGGVADDDVADLAAAGPIDRVVVRAPLRALPRPAWIAPGPRRLDLARRLAALAASPSLGAAIGSVIAAARG